MSRQASVYSKYDDWDGGCDIIESENSANIYQLCEILHHMWPTLLHNDDEMV